MSSTNRMPRDTGTWSLERALFALAGTVTLASIALAVTGEPVVPARQGIVGVSQWMFVSSATARRRSCCVGSRVCAGAPDERARPDRPARDAGRPTHVRVVFIAWAVVVVGLGVLAPRVETALSGAGWEDSGSESVGRARAHPA